jgi:hypothetical protein
MLVTNVCYSMPDFIKNVSWNSHSYIDEDLFFLREALQSPKTLVTIDQSIQQTSQKIKSSQKYVLKVDTVTCVRWVGHSHNST